MKDIAYARTFIKRGRQVLIVSVMSTVGEDSAGEIKRDFVGTAEKAKEVGADVIELNFSCPNTKERSGDIYNHSEDAAEIARAVKSATKLPIFIKIGFLPEEHLQQLVRAVSPYIDGIVAINTVSAPVKDQFGNEMFPGRSKAGTSGWIIQEVAHEVAKNLVRIRDQLGRRDTLDLLGLGGVMTKEDFWARLNTGVNAVEICTGAFLDPLLGFKIRQATSVGDLELEQNHELIGEDRTKVELQRPGIAEALPGVGGRVASVPPVQHESNKIGELPLNGGGVGTRLLPTYSPPHDKNNRERCTSLGI
jgi:dihydroorotate dehydrogenase (NAD+) catalytic subunit